jgi:hypothetical protein
MTLAKSGRTTGLTCGEVSSISTDVRVQYQQGCNQGKKFIVDYINQVVVSGSSFSAGGDSGSLMVDAATARPVALLYAGSSSTTVGNPISDVLAAFLDLGIDVSFVGGMDQAVTCPSTGGGGHQRGEEGRREVDRA